MASLKGNDVTSTIAQAQGVMRTAGAPMGAEAEHDTRELIFGAITGSQLIERAVRRHRQ